MWYNDAPPVPQPGRTKHRRVTIPASPTAAIPHDTEAEESILGDCIINPDKVMDIAADLSADEFYVPLNQKLWSAWIEHSETRSDRLDAITWARMAGCETSDIASIVTNAIGFTRNHVNIVKKHKVARDLMAIGSDIKARAATGEDPYEIAEELDHFVSTIGGGAEKKPEAMTIWEMSELSEANAPWVIPGALRQDWRAIITGPEGTGKGVLIRAMAMGAAAGIHPFTHRDMEPTRTLLVDLENPVAAVLETGLVLANSIMQRQLANGEVADETMFRIWHKPGGINIRNRQDRADLIREIVHQKPKLVCIGPWYKLNRSKPGENWEDTAMAVLGIIDDLRVKYGFAVAIEAHSPKASGGNKRTLDPVGSVYLKAWPELGLSLQPDDDFEETLHVMRFRRDRLICNWPVKIERSKEWVITGVMDSSTNSIDF